MFSSGRVTVLRSLLSIQEISGGQLDIQVQTLGGNLEIEINLFVISIHGIR